MPRINAFPRTPLITPERRAAEWRTILSPANLPDWVLDVVPVHTSPDRDATERCPDDVIVVLGAEPSRRGNFHFTTLGFAALLEICRPGHSCGVNLNNSRPPKRYAQVIFGGDGWRANEAASRILTNAGPGYRAKSAGAHHDLTGSSLYKERGPRASRWARQVALMHAERLANERPDNLPEGVTVDQYLANLRDLLAHYDEVCASQELSGKALPSEGDER